MRIFVGNLSFDAKEPDVKRVFESFGIVSSVVIKMKARKAKSRGFGFVEMPDALQAQTAITGLSGKELMGRPLIVNPARAETAADIKRVERKEESYQHRKVRQKKPWRGSKPWDKRSGGEAKPWNKAGGEAKPWKKTGEESKPWKKRKPGSKPWEKPRRRPPSPWKSRKSPVNIKGRPSK